MSTSSVPEAVAAFKELSSQIFSSVKFFSILFSSEICRIMAQSLPTYFFSRHQTHASTCVWLTFLCWPFRTIIKTHELSDFFFFFFSSSVQQKKIWQIFLLVIKLLHVGSFSSMYVYNWKVPFPFPLEEYLAWCGLFKEWLFHRKYTHFKGMKKICFIERSKYSVQ